MYTIPWDSAKNIPSTTVIIRDLDHAYIPYDDGNTDFQNYNKWVSQGNTPTFEPRPPDAGVSNMIADSAKALALSNAKSLVAQGDAVGATAALIQVVEKLT